LPLVIGSDILYSIHHNSDGFIPLKGINGIESLPAILGADKQGMGVVMTQQLVLEEKVSVEVKPGQVSRMEIKLQEKPAPVPLPIVYVELFNSNSKRRSDTGKNLLSFLGNSVENDGKEYHIDFVDGVGSTNIPNGDYFVVFNNLGTGEPPSEVPALVPKNKKVIDVDRIQYIRNELIYELIKKDGLWDNKKYLAKWNKNNKTEVRNKWVGSGYYSGVFPSPPPSSKGPPLPPWTTGDMKIRNLTRDPKTYLRLTKVLFHSRKNSTRNPDALFQCCKTDARVREKEGGFSKPGGDKRDGEQFVWTVYEGDPYIKLCGADCNISGRTNLEIFVEEIDDLGLVVKSVTAEYMTKVATIEWKEVPEEIAELKPTGVQLVYPDVQKQVIPHRVDQPTIIGIALWEEKDFQDDIVARLILTPEKEYPFSKTIKSVRVHFRAIQVDKDNHEDFRFNGINDSNSKPIAVETNDGSEIILSVKRSDILRERFLSQFVANFNMRRMLAI